MSRRSRSRNGGLGLLLTSTCLVLGLGVAGYVWWSNQDGADRSNGEDTRSSGSGKKRKNSLKYSSIVILSESLVDNENIDWNEFLANDCVILVKPGIRFSAYSQPMENTHKIIHCDTMTGVWSCIKHLRKQSLYYIQEELGSEYDDIPIDIRRLVFRTVPLDISKNINTQIFQ